MKPPRRRIVPSRRAAKNGFHCHQARRSTMKTQTTRRAVARFALVAAASIAAASLWAQNRPEHGLLLDAQTWQQEVTVAAAGSWPSQGWYRLLPLEQDVEVRAVRPGERQAIPADALYFR